MSIYCPLSEALGIVPGEKSILDFQDDPDITYNIPGTFAGQKHTEETKKIMSYKAKIRPNIWIGRSHSEESKKKMSESHINNTNAAKTWFVTHPDGHEEKITNMQKFCREHGLSSSNLHKTARGVMKKHQGYSLRHG